MVLRYTTTFWAVKMPVDSYYCIDVVERSIGNKAPKFNPKFEPRCVTLIYGYVAGAYSSPSIVLQVHASYRIKLDLLPKYLHAISKYYHITLRGVLGTCLKSLYHLFSSSLKSLPCRSLSNLASNSCWARSLSRFLSFSFSVKVKESPSLDPSLLSVCSGTARRGCCERGRSRGTGAPPRRRRSQDDPPDDDCDSD